MNGGSAGAEEAERDEGHRGQRLGGILMGLFYPLLEVARAGDDGVRPYADILIFTIGLFLSTFLFNFFFILAPIDGEPVDATDYFRGTKKAALVRHCGRRDLGRRHDREFHSERGAKSIQVGPAISYALGQGATMVSALWGLLLWREFAGATTKVRAALAFMLILFLAGLVLISVAPLYPRA